MKRSPLSLKLVAKFLLSAALVLAVAFATITPFCGAIFGCGCTYSEGMARCNIHDPSTPDCPWCSYGLEGFYVPFFAILGISLLGAGASLLFVSPAWIAGMAGGLIGYLISGLLVGFLTAWARGYPQFLFWHL